MNKEIEVMGHKANIDSVSARQADGIWHKEDFLIVGISFDDAVGSILGFGVNLPVKRYRQEEFLAAVKAEAENKLSEILEMHRQEGEKRNRQSEKQEALDLVVGEIKSEIGLP